MIRTFPRGGILAGAAAFGAVVYHTTLRDLRRSHANALIAIVSEVIQAAILLIVILAFLKVLNISQMLLRGNAELSVLTGIFLFLVHTRTVTKVATAARNPALLLHQPLSPLALYVSAALSGLYIQILALLIMGLITHVSYAPISVDNPARAAACLGLAWFSGLGVGILAASLWTRMPKMIEIATSFYARGNMLFSGKMLLAGSLSAAVLKYFLWNPLFHTIDQARGAIFINYTARTTNLTYPFVFGAVCLLLGLMIDRRLRG